MRKLITSSGGKLLTFNLADVEKVQDDELVLLNGERHTFSSLAMTDGHIYTLEAKDVAIYAAIAREIAKPSTRLTLKPRRQ